MKNNNLDKNIDRNFNRIIIVVTTFIIAMVLGAFLITTLSSLLGGEGFLAIVIPCLIGVIVIFGLTITISRFLDKFLTK